MTSDKHQQNKIRIFKRFKQHNTTIYHLLMTKVKAATKQCAKAAIKLAKPKGNSKHDQKKLVMAKNGVHLRAMTIPMRNLMKDLIREPRKPPRLKKLWKRKLRSRRLLMMMMRRKVKRPIATLKKMRKLFNNFTMQTEQYLHYCNRKQVTLKCNIMQRFQMH
jgi:hypothetical protein